MKTIVCLIVALLLAGCATTKSGVEKRYDMAIDNRGDGIVFLLVSLDAETQTDTKSGDAGASTDTSPSTALGLQGSTTSAAGKGATQFLKDILSYAEKWLQDNSTNPVEPAEPGPVAPVEPGPVAPVEPGPVSQPDRITLTFHDWTNGNRPTYYTGPTGQSIDVGDAVTFEVGTVNNSCTAAKRDNGTVGCDWPDGTIVRNAEMYEARGITVLIPSTFADNPPRSGWVEVK